jgi:hypothetical protein
MDLYKMIADLRVRREQIDEVIVALERMDGVKRRGRPPKSRLVPQRYEHQERGAKLLISSRAVGG